MAGRPEQSVQHFMTNEITLELRVTGQYDAVLNRVPSPVHRVSVPQWNFDDPRNAVPGDVAQVSSQAGALLCQVPPLLIDGWSDEAHSTGRKQWPGCVTRAEQWKEEG
jgi:hypothetical protein